MPPQNMHSGFLAVQIFPCEYPDKLTGQTFSNEEDLTNKGSVYKVAE